MTNIKRIATCAAGVALGALALSAIAAPANAYWDGNGHWRPDNRWNGPRESNRDYRYHGYGYRPPPVVYSTPYNYGYYPPPVVYDNTPGFTIRIQ